MEMPRVAPSGAIAVRADVDIETTLEVKPPPQARQHELLAVAGEGHKTRRVLARYDLGKVRITMAVLAILTTGAYSAYTLLGETAAMFDPRTLVWTIPFVLIGLVRFNALTGRSEQGRPIVDRKSLSRVQCSCGNSSMHRSEAIKQSRSALCD